MCLITAPLFAKYVTYASPTIFCSLALIIESVSYVLFGLLIWVSKGMPFIALSLLLRIISGTTSTIVISSSFTIVVKMFPDQPVFMISVVSMHIGLGLILGPTMGGALYQWGGFVLTFATMGAFLMLGGILVIILIPRIVDELLSTKNNIWRFISDPGAILDGLNIIVATSFFGFNATTLEYHLRQFG